MGRQRWTWRYRVARIGRRRAPPDLRRAWVPDAPKGEMSQSTPTGKLRAKEHLQHHLWVPRPRHSRWLQDLLPVQKSWSFVAVETGQGSVGSALLLRGRLCCSCWAKGSRISMYLCLLFLDIRAFWHVSLSSCVHI